MLLTLLVSLLLEDRDSIQSHTKEIASLFNNISSLVFFTLNAIVLLHIKLKEGK